MQSDVKKICQRIWRFEEQSKIYKSSDYSSAWHMVRMKIYYSLSKKLGAFSEPHPFKKSFFSWFKYGLNVVLQSIKTVVLIPFLFKTDSIIFEHPRTKAYKEKNIDIYSYFYANKIKDGDGYPLVFSRTINGSLDKKDRLRRVSIDFIEIFRSVFSRLLSKLALFNNKNEKLLNEIEGEFGLSIKNTVIKARLEYLVSYYVYKFIFSRFKKLRRIVLIDGYSSRAGLIKAAKDLEVEVVEIQHGVITKYHLGYSYSNKNLNVDYVPDKIFIWSEMWREPILSFNGVEADIFPNYYLEAQVQRYKGKQKSDSAIIISQGALSEKIAKAILENVNKFSSLKVYYKLHPSEYDNWKDNEFLVEILNNKNFELVKDADLFLLLAESKYEIGVFSTALFEGLELDCELILIDLPGIEYWESFQIPYKYLRNWNC